MTLFAPHGSQTREFWPASIRISIPDVTLTPLRISALYLVFGFGALLVSDVLLTSFVSDPLLSQLQALKGGAEVILTAGVIFALTTYREGQLQDEQRTMEQQHQELDVLHRVLRHNIRNDVNVILGHADLIRAETEKDQYEEHCDMILEKVEDLAHYTEQATLIRNITDNAGCRQTHDLTEILPRLAEEHPLNTAETRVSTSLPDEALVEANPQLPELLEELVKNAIQYNDAETPTVDIDVSVNNGPRGKVEISMSDNGPGIPDAELQALQAGHEHALRHQSGMGLWAVAWGVRTSGGALEISENDQGGTTVTVRLRQVAS